MELKPKNFYKILAPRHAVLIPPIQPGMTSNKVVYNLSKFKKAQVHGKDEPGNSGDNNTCSTTHNWNE